MNGNRPADGAKPSRPLASWYTQGRSDGLGDRLLMSDNTGTASLELLRFKREFAAVLGFESSLRERVEQLGRLQHPAFPRIHGVDYLDDAEGLTLVSTHMPGKRLSTMFHRSMPRPELHPGSAIWLIGRLTSAIAELQAQGNQVAHGALSADRIVLTPDRQVIVLEHVLGSALARLELPASRLWSDIGIIALPGDTGPPRLDCHADVVQIGLIALSVLLGRRVTPSDYPKHLDALLDEFSTTAGLRFPPLVVPLRSWLERALRSDGYGFRSARDARDGLRELPGDMVRQAIEGGSSDGGLISGAGIETQSIKSGEVVERSPIVARTRARTRATPLLLARALAAVFALFAIGEAAIITRLLRARPPGPVSVAVPVRLESRDPGEVVLVDGQQVGVTPMELQTGPEKHTIRVGHPDVPPLGVARASLAADTRTDAAARKESPAVDARPRNTIARAAARQRSGGLKLVSPIELQVLEGDRVLGSSADGPVVTTAGRHELEFVNHSLGYQSRQTVNIQPGEIISLSVVPPDGRISINAMPWAQVWIDGKSVGDTPLAYLPMPVGGHEIVFRHPQLGERRETAVVRSGALTRVSATFAR
jgi:hypothetical protein